MRLADEPGTSAEVVIAAPPERVWALVTDIELPARFSEEFLGASWVGSADGPAVGASFVGRSTHPAAGEWEAESFVEFYEEGRRFGWATVSLANPGSRWCYELEAVPEGTRLRYSMSIGPGPSGLSIALEAMPDKESRILERRLEEHHANMVRTLQGIASLAEAG